MALKLLRVLVLGVIAAAADDVPVTWSSSPRVSLPCAVANMDRLRPRRPPPPLDDDRPRPKIYSWRHGDMEISPKRVSTNGTLEVTRKRDGNEGVYQCAVRHHSGVVLGYPVNLKFANIEKKFWQPPENDTAVVGQPFAMTCLIRSAPAANVVWMKDDKDITQTERYHMLPHQLLITDVQKEDAGLYKCIVTNSLLRKSLNTSATLEVDERITDQGNAFLPLDHEGNITAPRGSRVILPCPVVGWPRPKLIWKLTPPVGRTSELESTEEVLVLTSLEYDQEGLYTCTIEGNEELVKTFNVVISEPAVIQIPPVSKEALRAGTVRFNCTAAGRPAPNVTWYKDGEPLILIGRINLRLSTDGKRTELVISGVTSDDAGVYQCFATNSESVSSAWATLNVTGLDAAPPSRIQCWPESSRSVRLQWSPPAAEQVVAYTVHSTPLEFKPGTSLPGQPHTKTEELVTVDQALTPFVFQVRAYMQPTANKKNIATDLSESVVCQGQGVPIKLAKLTDDTVVVSWKQFANQTPGVVQWILQYRMENSSYEHNITLDAPVYNYTLNASPPQEVRVLGSKSLNWLQQDLTHIPWVSTTTAGEDLDTGDSPPVPQDLEVTHVGAREFTITWRDEPASERYIYMVCARRVDGNNECIESKLSFATFDGLQPSTDYEVRVQARVPGRSLGGALSVPYLVTTLSEGPQRFKNLSGQFVNSSTLRLSWNGDPAKYTVHYSAELKLPVEKWDSVETDGNTVLIPGIDPTEMTYVMVTGYEPLEHSKIEIIPPLFRDLEAKELEYEYTRSGIRVWWTSVGPRVVCYAQNITRPVEQWASVNVAEPSVEITDLDPSLPTYVMVTASGKKRRSQVLTIDPRPQDSSKLYIGVGIGCGAVILCMLAVAAVCLWRKRKRSRSPVRSRRRNASAVEGNEEEGSEMKNIGGGRLENGGGSKDAGEPLLNGQVHITENPTSKTPNGKMKKGRRYEPAFDVSRYEDPNATLETVLDDSSTTYNLLDTSRRPEIDVSRSSREASANNSFNKLPDDNMNSELTRSTFALDNSKIQPTLQPNG